MTVPRNVLEAMAAAWWDTFDETCRMSAPDSWATLSTSQQSRICGHVEDALKAAERLGYVLSQSLTQGA